MTDLASYAICPCAVSGVRIGSLQSLSLQVVPVVCCNYGTRWHSIVVKGNRKRVDGFTLTHKQFTFTYICIYLRCYITSMLLVHRETHRTKPVILNSDARILNLTAEYQSCMSPCESRSFNKATTIPLYFNWSIPLLYLHQTMVVERNSQGLVPDDACLLLWWAGRGDGRETGWNSRLRRLRGTNSSHSYQPVFYKNHFPYTTCTLKWSPALYNTYFVGALHHLQKPTIHVCLG